MRNGLLAKTSLRTAGQTWRARSRLLSSSAIFSVIYIISPGNKILNIYLLSFASSLFRKNRRNDTSKNLDYLWSKAIPLFWFRYDQGRVDERIEKGPNKGIGRVRIISASFPAKRYNQHSRKHMIKINIMYFMLWSTPSREIVHFNKFDEKFKQEELYDNKKHER